MKKLCALLLLLCCLGGAAASAQFITAEETPAAVETVEDQTPDGDDHPWTYAIARDILDDADDVLVMVNKDNLLDKGYPADDDLHRMVEVKLKKVSSSEMKAREVAYDALVRLFEDAEADSMQLQVKSAYRSHYTQSVMYENRLKSVGRDDGVVQKGGASDHQTGLGFDILNPEWAKKDRMTTDFGKTAEAQWLAANCFRYGFIIRYPEGKTDITGIMYEPWHLRYVGVEVATYMTERGLTLEEFTAEWRHALAEYELYIPTEVAVDSFTF